MNSSENAGSNFERTRTDAVETDDSRRSVQRPGTVDGNLVETLSLEQAGDTDATLPPRNNSGDRPATATSKSLLPEWDDYEILGEIARGGMGVVYRARQKRADRIVALKMIRAGHLADPKEVSRFWTEAEVAANLEHPNIVPVYEVGQHDGHHFYSMAYVEGENLRSRTVDGPIDNKEAARIVQILADATAYAHERGIIHRDLKPENVLIDKSGQLKITDFGLAKRIDSDNNLTSAGQILGTPSYMSPEQAGGEIEKVGPASDVYSLGAILYCLLTGRPPFQAAQVLETLLQVMQREPVSPRDINPNVDRDLETLCLKCLDKDPLRRVGSARELAAELGRYLEGKPIHARPVSRAIRCWRWCRRNPVIAGLAAVILISLVVGASVSTYFAVLASQRARRAEEGTQIAVRTLQSVIHAVQEKLKPFPDAREVRRRLLRDSLRDLDRISTEFASQTTVDRSTAVALVDLGQLFEEVGSEGDQSASAAAERNYERAIEIYRQLVQQSLDGLTLRREMTIALEHLGNLRRANTQFTSAAASFAESLQIRRGLVESEPENIKYRSDLLYSLANDGDIKIQLSRKKEAKIVLDEALSLARELVAADAEMELYKEQLGLVLEKLGDVCFDSGDFSAAGAAYQEMYDIQKSFYDREPKSSKWMLLYSTACERIGDVKEQAGDQPAARQMYEKMWELSEQSAKADPDNMMRQDELAVACDRVGEITVRMRDWKAAKAAYERAAEVRAKLLERDQGNERLQKWLTENRHKLESISRNLETR